MHHTWKGWREGKLYFQEKWDKGKLIEGVSYDSEQKSYTYNQDNYMIQAEYEGGMKALYQFLALKLKYPAIARSSGIEGKVWVSFFVDKVGILKDIVVTKGIGGGCDAEAIRVVSALSKWKPGTVRGQLVNMKYVLPVHFKLEE
jgi:protein TonB